MARPHPDAFAAATPALPLTVPAPAADPALHAAIAPAAVVWPWLARALLLGGVLAGAAVGVLAMLMLAEPPRQAPDLARLLRAMVLIKGVILGGALTLVAWRLQHRCPVSILAGYTTALAVAGSGLGWLWGLSLLGLGSALFWGGLLGAWLVAGRDAAAGSDWLPAFGPGAGRT
ncbi:MAG: hypothetical protein EA400_03560 [Chromatiaceae bacterium]|nr:MAG: hypothetical protein EA400_03560 [Chromatiaceae bacterium]